jgi:TonB-dependent receptor
MKIICAKGIIVLGILLFLSGRAFGQVTLHGIVTDSLTQEPLFGASVVVVGTSQGTATDFSGEYKIPNISEGVYTLRVSYVGYETKNIQLPAKGNRTLELYIQLSTGKIEGKTIEVRAQAQGQLSAINEQLSSNNIVNVVSADKMKELPDANIAESIGRLPGVSLGRTAGEADKVIVRGLSSQFNKVTIEGVPMVSTSGGLAAGNTNNGFSNNSDRSIDLSMLSDDLVKGVELSKSLRANMDADAIGGTINLTLKEAPAGLHYDIQATGGYNDLRIYWRNYKVSGSVSNRFFDDQIGLRFQASAEDKALYSQQFNAGYDAVSTISGSTALIRNTNNSRMTVDNLDRKRYGGSIILDYESDFIDVIFLNLYSQKNDNDWQYNNYVNFEGPLTTNDNLFAKLYATSQFKTEERTHSLQAKFKFWGTELDASLSFTKGDYSNPGYDFPFMQVSTPNPFKPSDYIFKDPAALIAKAGADSPKDFYLRNLDITDNSLSDREYDGRIDYKVPFKLSDDFSGKLIAGAKFHELERSNDGTSLYFNMEWGGSAQRQTLFHNWVLSNPYNEFGPAGGKVSDYSVNLNHGQSGMYFMDHNYTAPKFLNGRYTLDDWGYNMGLLTDVGRQFWALYSQQYWIDGPQSYNSDYHAKENLGAGYLMAELNLGTDLIIVPGVRMEQVTNNYGAYVVFTNNSNQNGLAGQAPVWRAFPTTNVHYFPSVNLKYKGIDNVQIVGAYYISAARPNFSDLSPVLDYPGGTTAGNLNIASNPFLKPSIAQNIDLGASLFSNTIGLFSVNGFYKQIDNLTYNIQGYNASKMAYFYGTPSDILNRLPQFNYFDAAFLQNNPGATMTLPINNPEKAFVRGVELSWQTHLWYLPGVLSGIVLDLNLSFLSSHTFYPYFDNNSVARDTVWNTNHTRIKQIDYYQAYKTRPGSVLNMPKAIYNAIIGWDYEGFSSRISFRYQQVTITGVDAKYSLADTYYKDVLLCDISLKQKIAGNLSAFLNLVNIGKHIDDFYYSAPSYGALPAQNLPTSSQTYGFNAQFGISYYL